ncbi:hypothetical protein [Phascolarctobacterium faecium]|jgi:hypothetical protein|uniref:hypothetical protein n=1 Tax=Phascolarctobacterium faecium TaxID=33025 RepID=UPI002E8DFE66|nr:hypothetical protein [Phascolarctobacterium faecium]
MTMPEIAAISILFVLIVAMGAIGLWSSDLWIAPNRMRPPAKPPALPLDFLRSKLVFEPDERVYVVDPTSNCVIEGLYVGENGDRSVVMIKVYDHDSKSRKIVVDRKNVLKKLTKAGTQNG